MIHLTRDIVLQNGEVTFSFVRSSGPGGQNVNKVSTAAELRFDVLHSPSLSDLVKRRLSTLAGRRLTHDGVLVIQADRCRTQAQNRSDALERLRQLVIDASAVARPRRPTRPTAASRIKRIESKRRRAEVKRQRRRPTAEDLT